MFGPAFEVVFRLWCPAESVVAFHSLEGSLREGQGSADADEEWLARVLTGDEALQQMAPHPAPCTLPAVVGLGEDVLHPKPGNGGENRRSPSANARRTQTLDRRTVQMVPALTPLLDFSGGCCLRDIVVHLTMNCGRRRAVGQFNATRVSCHLQEGRSDVRGT